VSGFLKIYSVAPGNKCEWEEQILKELLRFEVNGGTFTLCERVKTQETSAGG